MVLLFNFIFIYSYVCMCVLAHVLWCCCGHQRTTFRGWFPPSIMLVPRFKLFVRVDGEPLNLLSHLSNPYYVFCPAFVTVLCESYMMLGECICFLCLNTTRQSHLADMASLLLLGGTQWCKWFISNNSSFSV